MQFRFNFDCVLNQSDLPNENQEHPTEITTQEIDFRRGNFTTEVKIPEIPLYAMT